MSNDYSIACNSPRYTFGLVWACVSILVYPVGVLALYAYFLWSNKDEIVTIKAAEVEARETKEEEKLRQELLRRELNDMQDAKETVALKKRLAKLTDRRRRTVDRCDSVKQTIAPAGTRIVTAAELTFLFKAYEGKVSKHCLFPSLFPFSPYHITPYQPYLTISSLYYQVLVLGVAGDCSKAATDGSAVRCEHRFQRADRIWYDNSASLHEAVWILQAV